MYLSLYKVADTPFHIQGDNISILANTRRCANTGLMLVQRHRWWANIKPALDQRLVFSVTSGEHSAVV